MKDLRPFLALLLCLQMISPAALMAQQQPAAPAPAKPNYDHAAAYSNKPDVPVAPGTSFWSNMSRPYRQPDIQPINLANTGRLEQLIRAGKLYLSLQDTIAIALENNLDIALSRYGPDIAQADYLRAKAGGLLRGVPTAVTQGPSSALSQTGISGTQAGTGSAVSGASGGVGGTVITQTGVTIPVLDPGFFFGSSWSHLSRPQANTVTTGGLTAIQLENTVWNAGYQQAFLTGTTVSAAWNNSNVNNNNPFNDLNPNTTSNIGIQVTQRMLQGWGLAVNNRNIRVAKNNLALSDLVFKQQVMVTVSAVVNLYWDLVSFNEDYRVKQKALEVALKFYNDNKKQVEIGTLAPIEIVRAEANVAQAQQDLTNSETSVLQQEIILKNALSRTGVASPTVADARIIPTDTLAVPASDITDPVEKMVERAIAQRPDLEQTRINLDNSKIALAGSRSQLLPSLDITASMQNNGLTGSYNTIPSPGGGLIIHNPDPYFIGGYGNALAQVFRRNFPDYSIGFNLSIPIRNRQSQADYIRDQLTVRQSQIQQQQQLNQVRVSVRNAFVALNQTRAAYAAAVKARQLQEQTLDAENKKYALGASTAFQVVQTQRDLAAARGSEVAALASYSRSRVQLDLSTADILGKYSVELAEAKTGKVARDSKLPPNIQ